MKKHVQLDETKVLMLLSRGSEYAFVQVFDYYHGKVFSVAYQILKSRELAKDVVQEVFIKLWNRRIAFGEVRNLEAFIFTVARNLTIDYLKKRSDEIAAMYQFSQHQTLVDNSYKHQLMDQQYEALLKQAVEKLPPQQREVFQLSRVEGLSHEDIASRLNISGRTVNNHINKALKFIRQNLEPYLGAIVLPVFLNIFE